MACVDGGGLVATELSRIKQLVRQLEAHLAGSPDLCRHLASQIFSLTERSIVMITSSSPSGVRKRSAADAAGLASPLSAATPTSDVTDDAPFRNASNKRKRKAAEERRHQVRVASAAGGGDCPVDDGHSWRKYGQKEILGAKHPRGYYRCTHRHSQGCQATKQVQRSDADPTLVDVVYHGEHTCVQRPPVAGQAAQPTTDQHNAGARTLLQSLSAGLTVKTEGLLPPVAADPQGRWSPAAAPAFAFSPAPASGYCPAPMMERSPFSAPSTTSENWGVSPATSDSNHAAAASFRPFEAAAEWEVVSALVAASAPPAAAAPLVDVGFADGLLDLDAPFFDVSSCIFEFDQQA